MLKTGGRDEEPGSLLSVLKTFATSVTWAESTEVRYIHLGRTRDLLHSRPYRCSVLELLCTAAVVNHWSGPQSLICKGRNTGGCVRWVHVTRPLCCQGFITLPRCIRARYTGGCSYHSGLANRNGLEPVFLGPMKKHWYCWHSWGRGSEWDWNWYFWFICRIFS